MAVGIVGEILAVNKHPAWKFEVERFNLRKLSELEVTKECHIKISNRLADLEELNDGEDINRAWESIEKNNKSLGKESVGLYVSKQHNPWFDEEYVRSLNEGMQTKTQRLQNANQSSVDNPYNVKREALAISGTKRRKI
jgi:hypothetical protein